MWMTPHAPLLSQAHLYISNLCNPLNMIHRLDEKQSHRINFQNFKISRKITILKPNYFKYNISKPRVARVCCDRYLSGTTSEPRGSPIPNK